MVVVKQNYIDGQWIEANCGESFSTRNPAAPEESVRVYQQSDREDATSAVEAAEAAADGWAGMPAPQRGEILREAAGVLNEQKDELTDLLIREEGKTRSEASGEVQRAIDIFYYYAEKTRDLGGAVKSASTRRQHLYTVDEPVGVAGQITPWNYPIAIPAWKMAPALATGNTLVLNPASLAPGPAIGIFEALDEADIPEGVANVVTGPGSSVGDVIVTHDAVDVVSFTGSSQVGESVYEQAVDSGKRVQTELGGKNPTIVSSSADLDEAVEAVSAGAFGVTGQACTACSRAIVHTDVHDEFVETVVAAAKSIDVGPGGESDMGPQVSESELESTLDYIEIAQEEGATLAVGGGELRGSDQYGDGYFVEPTVFTDIDPSYRLAQEEVFGPVLAVIEVENFEHALAVANDTDYGLSASIITNDQTEAERFVRGVDAGVAKVNAKTTGLELHVPFGGFKRSSSETWREQGDSGIDFYTIERTVYANF